MKKVKNKKVICLIICILLLVFVIQKSLSKYVMELKDIYVQESEAFYFESEFARGDSVKQYDINEWDGNTPLTIQFDIKNYSNQLLKTNKNITYKVNATVIDLNNEDRIEDSSLVTLEIKNEDSGEVVQNNQELTILDGDLKEDNYVLKITPNDSITVGKKLKVRISITSLMPYEKELVGEVNLTSNTIENYETSLTNSADGEYVTLSLKANNPQNDITIKYDNTKVILDQSSYIVNGLSVTKGTTINSFTIPKENLEEGKVYEIYFEKNQESIVWGTDIICG